MAYRIDFTTTEGEVTSTKKTDQADILRMLLADLILMGNFQKAVVTDEDGPILTITSEIHSLERLIPFLDYTSKKEVVPDGA